MMQFSFLSTILLFIVFVITGHVTVVVDGRRLGEENSSKNNNNGIILYDVLSSTAAASIRIEDPEEDDQDRRSLVWNVIDNLKNVMTQLVIESNQDTNQNQNHRSLGGGIITQHQQRQRSLYQEWARDSTGTLYWWIWLIIALSIAGCCCFTCCFSVCFLRD